MNTFFRNKWWCYAALAALHLGLCLPAFLTFRLAPTETLIGAHGDGMKNYFTLQSYVSQPAPHGAWRYTGMAYPFGDYVYFTDNTPLFAIPFRWICLHVHDWSAYAVPVFIWLVLLNIPVCGLLIFSVFRRCLQPAGIAFAAAAVLPWINPMLLRLPAGNHNLSLSSVLLAAFWLVARWPSASVNGRRWLAGWGVLLIVAAFLIHVYFLPLVAGMLAIGFGAWALWARARRVPGWKRGLVAAGGVPLAGAVLVSLLLRFTDGFAAMRNHRGMGYDWMELKTRFLSFISHYSFQRAYFPVDGPVPSDALEKSCYLGSIGWWLLSVILIAMAFKPALRKDFRAAQHSFWRHPILMPLAAGGLVFLSISFGERYTTGPDGLHLTNILNPFYYLRPLLPKLENFRALARFSWPFFFVFYLWLLHTARAVLGAHSMRRWQSVLVAGLLVLAGFEVKDFIVHFQRNTNKPNEISPAARARTFSGLHINFSKYQALLPLPLYAVGSEDGDLIIDERDDWTTETFALSLHSRLPLMSVKLSRTPKQYSQALLRTFAADSMPAFMRRRMDNRPVLIAFSRSTAADSTASFIPPDNPERRAARTAYFAALDFPRRNSLVPVDSAGDILFYSWQPPPLPPPTP